MTESDAIFEAVNRADLPRLAALLDAGADPNTVNPPAGNSLLYNACFSDRVEVALPQKSDLSFTPGFSPVIMGHKDRRTVSTVSSFASHRSV